MDEQDYILCDSDESVKKLASELSALDENDVIALDTEFERSKTFFPTAAMLQLRFGARTYLADPIKADINEVIAGLCKTRAVVLMYSASEDLEVISLLARRARIKPELPSRIVDLQLMSAFLGKTFMQGLAKCVCEELGITLLKSETHSDWLSRPLTSSQLVYAALDVRYLDEIYKRYLKRFNDNDPRLRWFYMAMEDMRKETLSETDPFDLYRQVTGAGSLDRKALERLRFLCSKRYIFAMENNVALNRVITGRALCPIAERTPLTFQGLASCGMNWGAVREHGKLVIDWIKESLSLPGDSVLPAYDAFSPGRTMKSGSEGIKYALSKAAQTSGICPELIATKKLINDWFYAKRTGGSPRLSSGWYKECVGDLDLKRTSKKTKAKGP